MENKINNFFVDSNLIFEALSSNSDDYIYIWNYKDGNYAVSKNLAENFKIPIEGSNFVEAWQTFVHEKDLLRIQDSIDLAIREQKKKTYIEYQVTNSKGNEVWLSDKFTIKYNEEGKMPEIIIGVMHNLLYDGDVDAITGLLMHTKCKETFELLKDNQLANQVSFMLIGIDDFTSINTLQNHLFGDLVLRKTAQEFLNYMPEGTNLYRYDGDQFLIVSEKCSKKDFVDLYEELKKYTLKSHNINGVAYRYSISAGIASYPNDALRWSELEKAVAVALKYAKETGKNRYAEFSNEVFEEKIYEQSLAQTLADSVEHNFQHFFVVFQPVCLVENLHVKGAEILLRFQEPDGDRISPEVFIPILEQSRLIIPVGLWVLEQAIKVCKKWLAYNKDFVMNVNVSYLQLRELTFCEHVERLLEKYDVDARNITLELTESYFITDANNIQRSMDRLRSLHIQVAMDDFGTGYSSLARLAQFNVDVVKIDRSFVTSLRNSRYNYDFVDSVVRLCHNVGMKVCVEGVETKEEQEIICVLNSDYIQGYYVSMPKEEHEFYENYILQPNINDELIVHPNIQLQRDQLVSDKDVLTAMMDATPLGLNFWNRDIEIIACNAEILQLFGASDFKEVKENFHSFSPVLQPDGMRSEHKVRDVVSRAFQGGKVRFYWEHCSANKEPIPCEVSAVRIPYMNDYIVASYTRDMREQRNMEEKIKQFNARLKAILDSNPLCLNLWNKNFQNIMCNTAAVSLFKLNNQQEYLDRFFELSPTYQSDGNLSSDKALEYINEAFHTGYIQFKWMHQTLEKECIPTEITLVKIEGLDEFGNELVAGYTRDLREQNAMEDQIERFNHRLEAILDSSPLCLNLWNDKFENIMCNKAAVSLFDLDGPQEYLKNFFKLSPEYQPDGTLSSTKATMYIVKAFEEGYQQFKWMHSNLHGEEIPSEITLVKIEGLDESGGDLIAGYTRDLRSQLHAQKLQNMITTRTRAVLDSSPLACVLWSQDLKIIDCNEVMVHMLGASSKADILENLDEFMPLKQPNGEYSLEKKDKLLQQCLSAKSNVFEWIYINKSKEEVPCEVTIVRITLEEEDIIVVYNRDLRELHHTLELNERLSQMAYYDILTGVTSRARFAEQLLSSFANSTNMCLILFDIDYFKSVNDSYGHGIGDVVLKRVSKAIEKVLPHEAMIGRYGGDEFMILLENADYDMISSLLKRMIHCIENLTFKIEGNCFTITISLGASFKRDSDVNYQSLMNRSDKALYKAKDAGRNTFSIIM